jgi:hypothetical protein
VGSNRRQAAKNQGLHQIAQSLGMKKSLQIKHLRDCESRVTGSGGVKTASRRAVEFSGRANAGFPDD